MPATGSRGPPGLATRSHGYQPPGGNFQNQSGEVLEPLLRFPDPVVHSFKIMDKVALRRRCLQARESLSPEEVAAASAAICERLAGWDLLRQARTVMTYMAFRNEPDLSALFSLLPSVRWVLPRIEGRRLILHPYDPGRLVRHPFGMLEPDPTLPVVDPGALDVVLVPGVAFDPQGGRLGFGGGYYDRFLPTTPALRVGVAFDACLIDALPCTEWDQRMDWVVTPTRLIRCGECG
ncbi:MAG TPA: 5-formyltetrahydrofolate cyclo-ligase [Anaerolineales bacterium]|nr:5-formyltetrahydrofolate cyclo-ligase [Anaerolineales bacterium]